MQLYTDDHETADRYENIEILATKSWFNLIILLKSAAGCFEYTYQLKWVLLFSSTLNVIIWFVHLLQ